MRMCALLSGCTTHFADDPCRLVRQAKKTGWLDEDWTLPAGRAGTGFFQAGRLAGSRRARLAYLLALVCISALAMPGRTIAQTRATTTLIPKAEARAALGDVENQGTKRALILCGLPGDKEHLKPFADAVNKIRGALIDNYRFAAADVHVQFGGPLAGDEGPVISGVQGGGTREEIESEAAELRNVLKPADALWVIVIGHAHYDGKHSYFNIPGPDLNEQDFSRLFAGLEAREQVFFIGIPASGFYIKPLSARGRVVITATEADLEVNETVFPLSLAEVLANPPEPADFDVDHDGRRTLFDLYIVLARNVAGKFTDEELLATEHSLLDDNGDGRGTELQIDYLAVAQGGRAKEGQRPPLVRENADGALSMRISLPPPPKKTDAEKPDAGKAEAAEKE